MTRRAGVLFALAALAVVGAALAYWHFSDRGRLTTAPVTTGLVRSVVGNDLVSARDPALTLRFDPAFRHVGGQKFILYGVADTEQHFFVETHPDGALKSVYWVQYEAYLPDTSYRYDYDDSPLRVELGGHEFFADTAVGEFDREKKRPRGTDGAMARQLLAGKGFTFPRDYAYARLVLLTDASRRKELMIIFLDDLAPRGLTAGALKDGGSAAARRGEVEQAHIERIRQTLAVLPLSQAP